MIIKTVTNGDRSAEFKAVSLGHAVTMFFGLSSIIGAMFTWNLAIVQERSTMIRIIREEVDAQRSTDAVEMQHLHDRVQQLEIQGSQQRDIVTRLVARLDAVIEKQR